MIEKIEASTKILKLNLQHFADTGVSGIAIGVSNFYYAPILKDTEKNGKQALGHEFDFKRD